MVLYHDDDAFRQEVSRAHAFWQGLGAMRKNSFVLWNDYQFQQLFCYLHSVLLVTGAAAAAVGLVAGAAAAAAGAADAESVQVPAWATYTVSS
jgi:hypothetical protein